MLIRFDELKEKNPDIVAWIRSDDPESTGLIIRSSIQAITKNI